jgi:hypothetical protein
MDLLIQSLTLDIVQETAFITCGGMTTKTEYNRFVYPYVQGTDTFDVHFENFDYDSSNLIMDFFHLLTDMKTIKYKEGITTRLPRVQELSQKIKSYLLMVNIQKVILIGGSHGSLLMRGAFMLLLLDPTLNFDHYNKIHIYSIGSPQALPSSLIEPYECTSKPQKYKLVNIYNRRDPTLGNKIYSSILKLVAPSTFPILKKNSNTNKVQSSELLTPSENFATDRIIINEYDIKNYFFPCFGTYCNKSTNFESNPTYYYHSNLYSLFPIFFKADTNATKAFPILRNYVYEIETHNLNIKELSMKCNEYMHFTILSILFFLYDKDVVKNEKKVVIVGPMNCVTLIFFL